MTDMDEAVRQLVEHLQKRKRYLQEIRSLARRQKGAIAGNNHEELLQLLEARERIMSQVDALDAADKSALEFMQSGGKSFKEGAMDQAPEEAVAVAREINSIIGDIRSLDMENIAAARRMQEDLGHKLEQINKHRRSKKLYTGDGKSITGALVNKTR